MGFRALLHAPPGTLAQPGTGRVNEAYRKVLRRARRVPSFAELRAQGMVIGERCHAQPGVYIDAGAAWLIEVGDDVGFSIDAMVLAHDASTRRFTGVSRVRSVRIGSRVFVGARAIILPGTTIGNDCIVGAGAVVKGTFPDGSVIAGVPARVVADVHEYAAHHAREMESAPRWSVSEWNDPGLTAQERAERRALLSTQWGYVGWGTPSPEPSPETSVPDGSSR